jgi:hypothetical protein
MEAADEGCGMSDIVWQDPPSTTASGATQRGAVAKFVEALKARPGVWARYPYPLANRSSPYLNQRRYPGTEWRTVGLQGQAFETFARWVGES